MKRSELMPERVVADEYEALQVPVIPCFKRIGNRSGRLGAPAFEVGWEGVKIVQDEETGRYKAKIDKNFTLAILEDGYCEIPKTPKNEAKLEKLLKPTVHMRRKMEVDRDGKETGLPVIDPKTRKPVYLDEVEWEEPAVFRKAKTRRKFDPKEDSRIDIVRPWLRPFVSVPDAVMLPHLAEG